MSYPAELKSVLVRERIIEVLRDISAGDDFFFTPGVVYDNYKNWKEQEAFPAYSIFFGAGGEWKEYAGLQAAETFVVIVHGDFKDDQNAPKSVRQGIRDVRKAIMDDMATGGEDSLATLCDHITLGATATDNGQGAMIGSGYFDQEFSITISGKIETL
jgi:hypothetical protein